MHIKNGIDIMEFLKQVDKCSGTVTFCTPEGERLVLNSALSQYFFIFISERQGSIDSSYIELGDKNDTSILADYLV